MDDESGDNNKDELTSEWGGESRYDWRGWWNESGSWFQRRGNAYLNEWSVIFNEDMVGGQERVTTNEEWYIHQQHCSSWESANKNAVKNLNKQISSRENDCKYVHHLSRETTTTVQKCVAQIRWGRRHFLTPWSGCHLASCRVRPTIPHPRILRLGGLYRPAVVPGPLSANVCVPPWTAWTATTWMTSTWSKTVSWPQNLMEQLWTSCYFSALNHENTTICAQNVHHKKITQAARRRRNWLKATTTIEWSIFIHLTNSLCFSSPSHH